MTNIYISSACINTYFIFESIKLLAECGIKNIELSGGTRYYNNYESDLLKLQDKFGIKYLVHNYFPPPEKPFVINLASLDDNVYIQSLNLCKDAIRLSKLLGSNKYGFHAGFLVDIPIHEIGSKISYNPLSAKNKAIKRFSEAWDILCDESAGEIKLYIENNVFSSTNAKTFSGINPFLLTSENGYCELKKHIEFNLLLDLAHLKVSSCSLSLDFEEEMNKLLSKTDYIHISENDGLHDQNKAIYKPNKMINTLKKYSDSINVITIEVYSHIDDILETYELLSREVIA